MRKLHFIQELVGSKILPYKAKKVERNLKACNFEHAKTIGIIYEALDQTQHKKVTVFADSIMKNYGITVQMVGFVSNAELRTAFSGQFGCKYIVQKDFNWYGIGENSIITDFIKTPFDILIDLSIETIYPLEYLALLSVANFKVGRFIPNKMDYDLMIDIKNDTSIDNLIEQIHVYLSMIKVKN